MSFSLIATAREGYSLASESFNRLMGAVRADRSLVLVVVALLAVDLFFTLYYGVARTMLDLELDPRLFFHKERLITTDGGLPEWFNYAKTTAIVILLLRLGRASRQPIYFALLLVFLVILFDDALEIHESTGRSISRMFDIPPMLGLRPRDVGEVITWVLLGALTFPLTVFGLARSERLHRGNGLALLLPFAVLIVCAVLVDQLYPGFRDLFFGAGVLLTMLEDGGEMFAITLAMALALGAASEQGLIGPRSRSNAS